MFDSGCGKELFSLRRKKQPSSLFSSAAGRRLCSTMRFAILFSQLRHAVRRMSHIDNTHLAHAAAARTRTQRLVMWQVGGAAARTTGGGSGAAK